MIVRALLKTLILPPGVNLLLLLVALVCWWRYRRFAICLAALSMLSLAAMSTPWVAHALARQLERPYPPVSPEQVLAGADAIVVLGGGRYRAAAEFGGVDMLSNHGLVRLRYAAHLHRQTGLPLLVSGGVVYNPELEAEADIMARSLRESFGLAATWVEPNSSTTRENARYSAEILAAAGVRRIALVSHAMHMRRAVREFSRHGLSVLPAPTGYTGTNLNPPLLRLLPSVDALHISRSALHEWLGYLAYQYTGA